MKYRRTLHPEQVTPHVMLMSKLDRQLMINRWGDAPVYLARMLQKQNPMMNWSQAYNSAVSQWLPMKWTEHQLIYRIDESISKDIFHTQLLYEKFLLNPFHLPANGVYIQVPPDTFILLDPMTGNEICPEGFYLGAYQTQGEKKLLIMGVSEDLHLKTPNKEIPKVGVVAGDSHYNRPVRTMSGHVVDTPLRDDWWVSFTITEGEELTTYHQNHPSQKSFVSLCVDRSKEERIYRLEVQRHNVDQFMRFGLNFLHIWAKTQSLRTSVVRDSKLPKGRMRKITRQRLEEERRTNKGYRVFKLNEEHVSVSSKGTGKGKKLDFPVLVPGHTRSYWIKNPGDADYTDLKLNHKGTLLHKVQREIAAYIRGADEEISSTTTTHVKGERIHE